MKGLKNGQGKGAGTKDGLRKNKNTGGCAKGGKGKGTGKGIGKGTGRKK